jgi:tRNA(fMet)-specific endonuclease VapC
MATSGRFVLDTNIVIALFNQDAAVKDQLATAAEIFVPATVVGELFFGAFRSTRVEVNIARIASFADAHRVVEIDARIARIYGQIKDELRQAGTPIPENDIWVAAVAKSLQAMLATRDEHFMKITDLTTANW